MRLRSMMSGLLGRLCNEIAPPPAPKPAPREIPLDRLRDVVKASLAQQEYPGPWQTHADGRRYRVIAAEWIDGRGVVPTLEWELSEAPPLASDQ